MARLAAPDEQEGGEVGARGDLRPAACAAAEEHWAAADTIARFRDTVAQAIEALEAVADRQIRLQSGAALQLFLHKYPVMQEKDPAEAARVVLTFLFLSQMRHAFRLMGYPAGPDVRRGRRHGAGRHPGPVLLSSSE